MSSRLSSSANCRGGAAEVRLRASQAWAWARAWARAWAWARWGLWGVGRASAGAHRHARGEALGVEQQAEGALAAPLLRGHGDEHRDAAEQRELLGHQLVDVEPTAEEPLPRDARH
eukprot:scaffold60200_cov67-Phaeocystis_antarctica.AAC.2